MSGPMLQTSAIVKDFGGTRALDHVSFEVGRQEVHAVVGANGAGKSTLVKVICGALRPDHGTIELEGRAIRMNSPRDAMRSGISVVHQQFSLVPELTVAENICLGRMPRTRLGLVDWRRLFEVTGEMVQRLGFDLDIRRPVKSLGAAGCQLVEIARALSTSARVLILDECSAVLGPTELEVLFKTIGTLKAQGQTTIYISHRLEEIFDVADRVTVMKDGKLTGTYDVDEGIDRPFLIREMVGRELRDQPPRCPPQAGSEVLRVENLTRSGAFEDVSLTLRAGEVVGLAGLVGSGRTQLSKAIFGAVPYQSGRIYLNGQRVRIGSPRDALSKGIAYLAEDRHREGIITCLSIVKNLTLPILKRFAPRGVLDPGQENRFADEMIRKVAVVTRGRHQVVASLSGGNQQKVALAKWLSTRARVFLLDEPTAGIDVGAKTEIYDLIAALARSGAAILMVSSEIPEILSMSSRIVVMRNGRVSGELSASEATEEKVLHYFA